MAPRPNYVAEWQEIEAPALRIVDQALFDQVQALRKRLSGAPQYAAARSIYFQAFCAAAHVAQA